MIDAPLKSILPYAGGKRTLAPAIVQEFGEHRAYFEPCCGSLALLFAKATSRMESVCDLYGHLVNLARVLIDPEPCIALYERVLKTLPSVELHAEACEHASREPLPPGVYHNPDAAYWLLVRDWLGRNGESGQRGGSTKPARRWNAAAGTPAGRWRQVAESIPAWHERLRGVWIDRMDCVEFVSKIADDPKTVVYVDPPYLSKTFEYVHDFTDDDHRRLAEALGRFEKARVVVSYYADERLRNLYPGWHCRRLGATKNTANAHRGKVGATDSPEVLLLNGPSMVEPVPVLEPREAADGGKDLFA